jgi:bis(5'-nucleosyl)-tetraphosphatase (symmetrical)
MASYVIGDIHGCHSTLRRLLIRLGYASARDRLLLTGDLVNRGPDSLGVLRWAREHDASLRCVLGNHDLLLLGAAMGVPGYSMRRAFQALLRAPDADDLLDWLLRRPLLVRDPESGSLLVHAGLLPGWECSEALALAEACSGTLQGPRAAALLGAAHPSRQRSDAEARGKRAGEGESREAHRDDEELSGQARFLRAVTLLRLVDQSGAMVESFTAGPKAAPRGTLPWFEVPGRKTAHERILFGHWARLGLMLEEKAWCLDSACVWGKTLTAVRLEDGRVFQEPNAEGGSPS